MPGRIEAQLLGCIKWLPPKNEVKPGDRAIEDGCYEHPAVIISHDSRNGQVEIFIITSFGGENLKAKYPSRRHQRRRLEYLPITPSAPHPDIDVLLELQDSSPPMKKKSYVKVGKRYRVLLTSLGPYDRGGTDVFLSGESYQTLVNYAAALAKTSSSPSANTRQQLGRIRAPPTLRVADLERYIGILRGAATTTAEADIRQQRGRTRAPPILRVPDLERYVGTLRGTATTTAAADITSSTGHYPSYAAAAAAAAARDSRAHQSTRPGAPVPGRYPVRSVPRPATPAPRSRRPVEIGWENQYRRPDRLGDDTTPLLPPPAAAAVPSTGRRHGWGISSSSSSSSSSRSGSGSSGSGSGSGRGRTYWSALAIILSISLALALLYGLYRAGHWGVAIVMRRVLPARAPRDGRLLSWVRWLCRAESAPKASLRTKVRYWAEQLLG